MGNRVDSKIQGSQSFLFEFYISFSFQVDLVESMFFFSRTFLSLYPSVDNGMSRPPMLLFIVTQ